MMAFTKLILEVDRDEHWSVQVIPGDGEGPDQWLLEVVEMLDQ